MCVTKLTSHAEMSALNDVAPRNMFRHAVTELVFHAVSALKDVAPSNIYSMELKELCVPRRDVRVKGCCPLKHRLAGALS